MAVFGHKVAKQRKKLIGREWAARQRGKKKVETPKLGESLSPVKSTQRALWFSRNMTHITVFN